MKKGVLSLLALMLVVSTGVTAGLGIEPKVVSIVASNQDDVLASGFVLNERAVLTASVFPRYLLNGRCAVKVYDEGELLCVIDSERNGWLTVLYVDHAMRNFEEPEIAEENECSSDDDYYINEEMGTVSWMNSTHHLQKVNVRLSGLCPVYVELERVHSCADLEREDLARINGIVPGSNNHIGGPVMCQDGKILGITSLFDYNEGALVYYGIVNENVDFVENGMVIPPLEY